MESLTRLVSESLARHGFDRPLDYRRLQWSRWFRCESHHSLLAVPSRPGVFALAEEIMDLARDGRFDEVGALPGNESGSGIPAAGGRRMEASRMLAVAKFFEDDDMAFVLDRMLSHKNAMQERLASGRYFVRYVVIEDEAQRRSICNALNQWIVSAAEKASGIGSDFASSLEFTPALGRLAENRVAGCATSSDGNDTSKMTLVAQMKSGAAPEIHCRPSPLPSGF